VRFGSRQLQSTGNVSVKTPFWDLFERSVDALIGRPHARCTYQFSRNVEVESLDELMKLVRIVEAVRSQSPRSVLMLIEFLSEASPGGRTLLDLISEIGPAAADVVPELIRTLNAGGERSYWAVRALGQFGPAARCALPALAELQQE